MARIMRTSKNINVMKWSYDHAISDPYFFFVRFRSEEIGSDPTIRIILENSDFYFIYFFCFWLIPKKIVNDSLIEGMLFLI